MTTHIVDTAELGMEITPDYARARLAELRAECDREEWDFDDRYRKGMHDFLHNRTKLPLPTRALFWIEVQALERAIEGAHDQFPAAPVYLNLAQYMIDPQFEHVPEEAS